VEAGGGGHPRVPGTLMDPTEIIALACAFFCVTSFLLFRGSRASVEEGPAATRQPAPLGTDSDRRLITNAFWAAFGIRVAVGLMIALSGTSGFFALDNLGY